MRPSTDLWGSNENLRLSSISKKWSLPPGRTSLRWLSRSGLNAGTNPPAVKHSIIIEVPDRDVNQTVADQLTGEMKMKDITLSTVGSGDIFGFPALIPPYNANASAKAITQCRVIEFDCTELLKEFDKDCGFGYVMTQRVAQLVVERLRDMRVETLACIT